MAKRNVKRTELEIRTAKASDRMMGKVLRTPGIGIEKALGRQEIIMQKIAANHILRFDLGIRGGKKVRAVYMAIEHFQHAFRADLSTEEMRRVVEISERMGNASARARMKAKVSQQQAGLRQAVIKILGKEWGEKFWELFKEKVGRKILTD